MTTIKVILLIVACLLAGSLYISIYKLPERFSNQYRFPVALDMGQMTSFVIGMLLYLICPLKFSVSCAINIWIGAFIGIFFCSIKGSQSVAAGFFYGGLATVMGTMVAAAAVNPTLCGLPISKLSIENPGLVVGIFGLVLLAFLVLLVRYPLKNEG